MSEQTSSELTTSIHPVDPCHGDGTGNPLPTTTAGDGAVNHDPGISHSGEVDAPPIANSPPPVSPPPISPIPYSNFTKGQKIYITYLLGFLTLASSLTATIYFPLIPLLAKEYHTTSQAINITITVYVVLQGISPSFWSPLSDVLGRRPVFLATFGLYTAASLGLAFTGSSYVALLLLRATQSIGGSAVLSLAYGVVADLVPSSQRGTLLGPMLASGNLGPCVAPVIGGAVEMTGRPVWCFWALVIFGGIAFLLIGWTFPETRRTVVGNGAVPAVGVWRTWWSLLIEWRRNRGDGEEGGLHPGDVEKARPTTTTTTVCVPRILEKDDDGDSSTIVVSQNGESNSQRSASKLPVNSENPNIGVTGRGKLIIPNPFTSLRLVFYCDTFIALWLAASPYAVWYLIQTSITSIYGQGDGGYGFKDIYVGLCYIPGGAGVVTGGFIAGRIMDMNYKHIAAKAGFSTNKNDNHNIHDFPIEKARSRFSLVILTVSMCLLVGYAWAVKYKVHPAVPLILQFFLGAKCTILLQVYSALVVDIFPEQPSTIAASNNITRCGLSAALVAALDPAVKAMGRGWFFTMMAFLDAGLSMVGVIILRRWGKHWRNKRRGKYVK